MMADDHPGDQQLRDQRIRAYVRAYQHWQEMQSLLIPDMTVDEAKEILGRLGLGEPLARAMEINSFHGHSRISSLGSQSSEGEG